MNSIKLRNIFFLIFTFITNTIAKENYSIIYVHLGYKVPDYLYDSIKQTRLFNPVSDIYIVCYEEVSKIVKENIENLNNIFVITQNELNSTGQHKFFLKKTHYDGFWRFSSERFFYIEEVMQKYNLTNVFHLESDNLLYIDLEEHIDIFIENYPGIAATFDNDDRCIGGFMYIKNKQAIHMLNNLFASLANQKYNDMQIMSKFKKQYSQYIDSLPIVPNSYGKKHILRNLKGERTKDSQVYSKNFECFNSIFDAAALGQFLGGTDPIHKNSGPGFINETCVFNPSNLKYRWIIDNKNRKIPIAILDNKAYKINNLHIHCKNLKKFIS